MVWRESRRESIRWFASKSSPWTCAAYPCLNTGVLRKTKSSMHFLIKRLCSALPPFSTCCYLKGKTFDLLLLLFCFVALRHLLLLHQACIARVPDRYLCKVLPLLRKTLFLTTIMLCCLVYFCHKLAACSSSVVSRHFWLSLLSFAKALKKRCFFVLFRTTQNILK